MFNKIRTQLRPHAVNLARGTAIGCGAVGLALANAKAGIAASKIKDFNGRPDTFEEKNTSDVYSGIAAIFSTKTIMSLKNLPMAQKIGLTVPISIGAAVFARWIYEKSGKLLKIW